MYVNLLNSVKQEFRYFINPRLFDGLFPSRHYCHGLRQARHRGLHSCHPLDVVHIKYQQYLMMRY